MESSELLEKKFSIVQEISAAIAFTDNVSTISNLILDLATNYTNAEKGSLMLLNEKGELYICTARGIDTELIQTYKVKIGTGIAGIVAENCQSVLVEDIEKDARFRGRKRDRYKTRSFISCPVISKSKLLGVLNINDKVSGASFTEDEFTLIKIIANQAAIAIENAFLINQIKTKATEIEEINKKLIEADVTKTEFLTRLSHELRNPLNSIKGAIFYLQQSEKLTKSKQMEFHNIVSEETDKLSSFIENQFDFLRIEDEIRIIKKSIINLTDILKDIIKLKSIKTTLARKNIEIKIDISKRTSDIVGDKLRVIQFFINIIEGMSHHLDKDDCIEIKLSENDFVRVTLNFSRRIPDALLSQLFNSRHIFKGKKIDKNIRLYLAKKVAEVHKWDFAAENIDDRFQLLVTIPKSTRQKLEALFCNLSDLFIEFISEALEVSICSIMVVDEFTRELTIASSKGIDDEIIKHTRIKLGDSIAGWVALEGKPLFIENIENDPRFQRRNIPPYNTKSLISLPLKIQDKIFGVLNINNKKRFELFTSQDLDKALVISERFSHLIEKLYSADFRENEFKRILTSFENLINAEKNYFKKKNIFSELMIAILNKLNIKEEDKKIGLYISLIYDLGLMLIDKNILLKKGRLLFSEERILKTHPYTTLDLISNFEFSEDVKKIILHHHERFDGKGYPDRLKGKEIPLLSRVLSVIDSFCAMITDKPYRRALSKEAALYEIKKGSGSQYDPAVVNAFEEIIPLF